MKITLQKHAHALLLLLIVNHHVLIWMLQDVILGNFFKKSNKGLLNMTANFTLKELESVM